LRPGPQLGTPQQSSLLSWLAIASTSFTIAYHKLPSRAYRSRAHHHARNHKYNRAHSHNKHVGQHHSYHRNTMMMKWTRYLRVHVTVVVCIRWSFWALVC